MDAVLKTLIEHYESLHDGDLTLIGLQPKMDCVGIWTEGWGRVILDSKGKMIKGIGNKKLAYSLARIKTKEQADAALEVDIVPFRTQVHRKITIDLEINEEAALISHFYNTGGSSTLANLVNTKDKTLFDWWCNHYIIGQGVTLKGLVYRRKSEALLFTTGKLQFFN